MPFGNLLLHRRRDYPRARAVLGEIAFDASRARSSAAATKRYRGGPSRFSWIARSGPEVHDGVEGSKDRVLDDLRGPHPVTWRLERASFRVAQNEGGPPLGALGPSSNCGPSTTPRSSNVRYLTSSATRSIRRNAPGTPATRSRCPLASRDRRALRGIASRSLVIAAFRGLNCAMHPVRGLQSLGVLPRRRPVKRRCRALVALNAWCPRCCHASNTVNLALKSGSTRERT